MRSTSKIALAAAVAGGYVPGRTKKGRLAFTVATYLVGRRFRLDPGQLMTQGLAKLEETPQFAEITDQPRSEALFAGKKALGATDEAEGWRGEIRDGEVVRTREEALEEEAGAEDEDTDEGEDGHEGEDDETSRPRRRRSGP